MPWCKQASYETTSVYGFGHPLYYDNVIRALRGEVAPETDGREGLRSLELLIGDLPVGAGRQDGRAAAGLLGGGGRTMDSVLDLEAARLRQMTASEKIAVMHSLWRQAWALKAAGVRGQHPDWSPAQVTAAVREIFRDARS